MLTHRLTAVLLVCALSAVVGTTSGCTSSGGEAGTSGPTSPSTGSGAPTSAATNAGLPAAVALAAKMRVGLTGLRSAHVNVDAGVLGGKSGGDFSFANGKATASDITVDPGADATEIVTIGAASYAKLPKSRNTSNKPWVRVSETSKNEFVRALASRLTLNQAAASLPVLADIVATASSVHSAAPSGAGGAEHYSLIIDSAKSGGSTLGILLRDLGTIVPIDVFLDSVGRPVRIHTSTKVGSTSFGFTVTAGKFNAPVHITAPAADQVSSG